MTISADVARSPAALAHLPGVYDLHVEDHHVRFQVESRELDPRSGWR